MHPDYLNLSGQYASFLSALGGISITMLAIVLAIRNPDKTEFFAVLVNTLLVATLACFVGSHLMAQTAAMKSKEQKPPASVAPPNANPADAEQESPPRAQETSPGDKKPLVVRYFVYASVNVYFALMLVSFAMMLLPSAFLKPVGGEQAKPEAGRSDPVASEPDRFAKAAAAGGLTETDFAAVSKITKWVFYFVVSSAYFWSFYYHDYRLYDSDLPGWIPEAFLVGLVVIPVVWAIYLYLLRHVVRGRNLSVSTFILHIILIGCSVFLFAFRAKIEEPATPLDIWFFCAAVALSGASLWGLRLRLYDSPHTRYSPLKWRREPSPQPEGTPLKPPVRDQVESQENTKKRPSSKGGKKGGLGGAKGKKR
ncbi:MAG TPA: hypothetical protein VGC87_12525 [Pyrinomonadaceae bacterium]|jgi:hypothetical protein